MAELAYSLKQVRSPLAALSIPAMVSNRECACEGKPEEDDKAGGMLQRRAVSRSEPASVPAIVGQALSGPGEPLDEEMRSFMESRFGHDSRARIHTEPQAARVVCGRLQAAGKGGR